MRKKTLVYMMLFGMCHANGAFAQGVPMTLEETLSYVQKENPTILKSRYGLRAVMESYSQAQSGWKPRINSEASLTSTRIESGNFNTGDGATTKGASINIEQPLFRGFKTVSEMESAKNRISAEKSEVERTEQEVFVQSAEVYMNVIRDRLLLTLQRKNKELLNKERESVKARFDAGDVTQTDVKQTEARYSNAVADDAIAESKLRQSEAEFEKITGLAPADTMAMPAVKFPFPNSVDGLLEMAALQNPLLSRSRYEHEAAESDINAAKSDFYPQLSAFASHVKEYDPQPGIVDESETSTIGVRARMSLYEGGNTLSRTREAKSRANQRFVAVQEAEMAVKSDLIAFWRRLQAYESEIAARELEVSAAAFSSEGVREEARLGERTVLDTLEAEQDVIDAETALIEAKRDRIVTAYKLAAALGLLKPENLGFESASRTE